MIPKHAHFVWLDEEPPAWVLANIQNFRFHHPDWTIWLWHHPPGMMEQSLRELMDELPYAASRSDILRYWIMAEQGGVYLDCDNYVLRNFDPLLNCEFFTAPCMTEPGTPPNMACGLMGSFPGSYHAAEIIRAVYTTMKDPAARERKSFGPDMLTPLWAKDPPTILPAHYFYLIQHRPQAHAFWLGTDLERGNIMAALKHQWADGVPPYSVHLWGVNDSSTRQTEPPCYAESYRTISQCRTLVD